ncbi:unnamed protein product [Cylindrotheca closterium]|uniref:Uncharacterized protein n=1 Tax=Cylindrotheca closterium TaxID=2856 RepID=A0AAD2FQC5_9STRA|nr:unnamed protein product [Cylindrotheca closterium]
MKTVQDSEGFAAQSTYIALSRACRLFLQFWMTGRGPENQNRKQSKVRKGEVSDVDEHGFNIKSPIAPKRTQEMNVIEALISKSKLLEPTEGRTWAGDGGHEEMWRNANKIRMAAKGKQKEEERKTSGVEGGMREETNESILEAEGEMHVDASDGGLCDTIGTYYPPTKATAPNKNNPVADQVGDIAN